jgi:hypothetical protein
MSSKVANQDGEHAFSMPVSDLRSALTAFMQSYLRSLG